MNWHENDIPPKPDLLREQLEKMLAASKDPRRQARAQNTDLPWTSPVFAIAFAMGKLSRIVNFSGEAITVNGLSNNLAEELREVAHYCLKAAALVEGEERHGLSR